ncbi:MAG TPA: HD domain-containing phosphohydrolase, partial [Actinomycetota bacterium]|jgi:response regulator RpfG family c-di-GMP phosphodiesterase
MASALHDAGKIGIPDGILLKPGPLDAEEYAIMQRHAQIGYRLLAGSASPLIELGAIVALNHHERWDGAGYPRGLRDGEIPEIARIAAVCDVFDALTSNRVYRPAMPFEKAIEIMIDLRGRHFETRLCDAFLDSMDDVRAIRNDFPDPREEDIRVLIVDDHEMFAESMIRLLVSHGGIKVVARAGSRAEARKLATAHEPDVILMDYELPDGTGATTTEEIKLLMPSAKVVMLTGRTDDEVLVRAITAGCSGFVTKQEAAEKVVHAIRSVHAGEALVSLERLPALLEQLRPTHRGLGAALTPREVEVLRLVAQGRSNKDIAGELGLSRDTLRNHVQSILDKLQAPSKLQAVATAAREGILVGSAIDPEGHSGDRSPGHNGQEP